MRTCEYQIEGNPDGPTVVFIHGWPDDARLWHAQVPALGSDFRCVLVTLPNFGRRAMKIGGFDFPELVEMLANTVRAVQPEGRVHLVTHDWGTYMGYSLEKAHPELVERMVALDVGGHIGRPPAKAAAMLAAYQWALIAAWIVGGVVPPLGNALSRIVGAVVRVPKERRRAIRSRFNYSYFYLWRAMLLPWKRASLLGRYRPQCPLLYLYGRRKPLMFHSPKWLRIVEESGGRWEELDAGHWLMESRPDEVNERIRDWLAPAAM